MSSSLLQSYTKDSIRVLCTIVEKNFHDNQLQCEQIIDFVSRWLLFIDDDDERKSLHSALNHNHWYLAHVYTSIEYNETDLLSLYSACRIIENLDRHRSFYDDLLVNENISRSKVRENLFQLMFDHLWTNLRHLCQINENPKQWIHSYTLISKYYPSENVLQRLKYVNMKVKIEFMNLVYLILLNEKIPQPIQLIQRLFEDTSLIQDNIKTANCLQLLSTIIQTIDKYFKENNGNHSTLLIDIQQWIIAILNGSKESSDRQVIFLLKFLDQSTCHLLLPMKQFLFDELITILIDHSRKNCRGQWTNFWDRISFLPTIINCVSNENLETYQLPYHPFVINNDNQNSILIDLFFFHLRRLINQEKIRLDLIHKIQLGNLQQINYVHRTHAEKEIFEQFQKYFLIHTTALLLCQLDFDNEDPQRIDDVLRPVIDRYLTIPMPIVQLNDDVELFCSIIITKRSRNFLLELLKSELFQHLNTELADSLYQVLELTHHIQRHPHLHYSHQLQFTLTVDNTSSIFPTLHQPYYELMQLIGQCVKLNINDEQRWTSLIDWIQSKLNSDPPLINAIEIKVMLLLNIYYNYYCHAQLKLLDHMLTMIENTLQLSDEEQRVFRVLLQPEQYMIGYSNENNANTKNYLNDLFHIDYHDEEQLPIRHMLVNLMAMILLSGKENTLWTFAFEPLKLENTYGQLKLYV